MSENRIQSFRELRVWKLGMEIAVDCYRLTRKFPDSERYGLSSQIQRCSSRIPANIAEGYGRGHRGEYLQFLRIANGSLNELETHLELSVLIGLSDQVEVKAILQKCSEEGKMLVTMIKSLEP